MTITLCRIGWKQSLTDKVCEHFRLSLPGDADDVDRYTGQRDDHAHETLKGAVKQRHDDEEDRHHDEQDREHQVHLKHNRHQIT